MSDAAPGEEATLFPKTAGERLREAREAQGLSLAEIASRTRIPMRQLEAIEASNYAALPSITYSVGFAKAYARAVGVDEVDIAREVRSQNGQATRRTEYEAYEMPDPSRTPTSGLVLGAVAVAVLLLIGVGLWYGTTWFRGEDAPAVAVAEVAPPVAAPTPAPTPTGAGQVTLIAADQVWLRVYDATGKTLFQDILQRGARFDVPADANGPMINVGRPDKLEVMVNGSRVSPLGTGERAIKDVPISAAALIARLAPASAPEPAPTATPVASSTASAQRPTVERLRPVKPKPAATVTPPPPAPVPTPEATLAP